MATHPAPAEPEDRPRTADEIERDWFENVYAGDRMPQFTLRACIMGMFLGALMCLSNVYVGLKAGWSMGVAITSCILAYVFFQAFTKVFRQPGFSILENNAMSSAASAAGMMTSAGIVNAIPALMMLNPQAVPPQNVLIVWVVLISFLGVFLAVPAKRQFVNIEQLPFPSGRAAAATLRALHETGGEAQQQARSLGLAGALGALITFFRDADFKGPYKPPIPTTWGTSWLRGPWFGTDKAGAFYSLSNYTMSFEGSLLFVASGALLGFRQAWSMLLGAAVNYVVLAPIMFRRGDIERVSFSGISRWSLWIGVPMMVTSGLLLFALNWRTVLRAFSAISGMFGQRRRDDDPLERIEVPATWFIGGVAVVGTAIVVASVHWMHIAWWMAVIAVLATFLLVVVAARATGETDITPVGPLSKITQLTFGAIKPGDVSVNLLTAQITSGATSHAGDLLEDLKSGYLLGANPRQQFLAQFFGVLAGGVVVVPAFFFLIRSPADLGTERWPAPAALTWKAVAELLKNGPQALPHTAQIGLWTGAILGIVLVVLERLFPKAKAWIPAPTGLGIAFTINGFNSVSFFIGACIALWLSKARPKVHETYTVPVSSGIIAGESLMGVLIAVLTVKGLLE